MKLRRSAALIAIALGLSAVVLRPQLSSALLSRGDALAFYGDPANAERLYERAIFVDPQNGVAVDRLAFLLAFSHDPTAISRGIRVASAYLRSYPDDATVRMDRAMCFQQLGQYRAATADFAQAGETAHDPRAFMFAALDSLRGRERARAQKFLRLAIRAQSTFSPARRALARLQ